MEMRNTISVANTSRTSIIGTIYLLLTEFEVRTKLRTEFFLRGFMAQARSARATNPSEKNEDP